MGVIRPPYKDNPHYGICAGILLPNKQIQFTFQYNDARELEEYLNNHEYRTLIRLLNDN